MTCYDSVHVYVLSFLVLGFDVVKDLVGQLVQSYVGVETPLLLGQGVVQFSWPRICDHCSNWAKFVVHGKSWDQFFHLDNQLFWVETDSVDIIHASLQIFFGRLEVLNSCNDAVIDIHHWKRLLWSKPAFIVLVLEAVEEYFSRVISGSVKRKLLAANDSGVSDASEVDLVLLGIVLSKQLGENLAHSVDGLWLQDGVVWSKILVEIVAAEGSDSRWNEKLSSEISSDIESVLGSSDVDIIGQLWVLLPEARQDTGEMYNIIYVVLFDNFLVSGCISNIKLLVNAGVSIVLLNEVAINNVFTSNLSYECVDQRFANLASASSNQDLFLALKQINSKFNNSFFWSVPMHSSCGACSSCACTSCFDQILRKLTHSFCCLASEEKANLTEVTRLAAGCTDLFKAVRLSIIRVREFMREQNQNVFQIFNLYNNC